MRLTHLRSALLVVLCVVLSGAAYCAKPSTNKGSAAPKLLPGQVKGNVTVAGFTFKAIYTETNGAKEGTGTVKVPGIGKLTLNFLLLPQGGVVGTWTGNIYVPGFGGGPCKGDIKEDALVVIKHAQKANNLYGMAIRITPTSMTGSGAVAKDLVSVGDTANWHIKPGMKLVQTGKNVKLSIRGTVTRWPKGSDGKETGESQKFGMYTTDVNVATGVAIIAVDAKFDQPATNVKFKLW